MIIGGGWRYCSSPARQKRDKPANANSFGARRELVQCSDVANYLLYVPVGVTSLSDLGVNLHLSL